MSRERKHPFSTTQIIAFGFLFAILLGSVLLTLPIATVSRTATSYVDALFTATTSVCVTGLTTVVTATHWSLFGQLIILILIQFGGLGIVTFTTCIMMVFHQRITLHDRLLIQDAYNLRTLQGLVKLTKRIIMGAFLVEGIGALFLMLRFIPTYGFLSGIWKSIFISISAFCNAGIDLVGDSSLIPFRSSVIVNLTIMCLIIVGGIGFPVWGEVKGVAKAFREKNIGFRETKRRFSLHAKIVFSMTFILILSGAVLFFALEWNNPDTIGNFSLGQKIMASFFQSVTTRTAGFCTINQASLKSASAFLTMVLMFIGGSPSGTAGGVKTVTVAVILIAVWSTVRNKKDVESYHKRIGDAYVKKALSVITISVLTMLLSTFLLSITEKANFLDMFFEVISALATVGLTRGITPELSTLGKIIIVFTMYLGRIGPITLALAMNVKEGKTNSRTLPEEKVSIG